MRFTTVVLAVVVTAAGCATTTGRRAGAVSAVASSVAVAAITAGQFVKPSNSEGVAPEIYILTAALLVGVVSGGIAIGAELLAPPPSVPVIEARSTQPPGMCDPRAEQLTQQARQAARLGQCGAVISLGERVRDLDAGCYAIQFVAIRCER